MKKFPFACAALLVSCLTLAACGGDGAKPGSSAGAEGDASGLPAPAAQGGSITGMPDPRQGGGQQVAAASTEAEALPDPMAEPDPADANNSMPASNEPGADAAVRVIRDYYAAINLRNHAGAYALWRNQGQASGVSAEQFAQDFATTSGISVEIGEPGPIDPGAGQRHIEVPVSLVVRNTDGSEQRFRGKYVLQRTVVDGASEDQRAWRIASAQLSASP